ncbi:TRAP dicarboxylate transporter, DctP subunit [Magnetococcus marinus MC-1]|uniref:TRAP dicarboxylate transporter, DctP subunit n=1 Tax=Magnetococcus marinus (strain ATCC BAA-1437 / JCM 17883 / MC-1) TaxID=156889 RepID=A0L9J7_MAGMM|nr:TRAP transporter substrate-binding protein [Magnetococcus marinus]ABK44640.1 TRAP dicarboxylate transporter, DctP subunit [Magnetococcus marinus MC-1]
MKNIRFGAVCAAAALAVAGIAWSGGAQAAEYVIKLSHVVSPQTPKGKAADIFAQLVNERLQGKVRVEVFPSSQLYDDNKVMEAMRLSRSKTVGLMAAPSLSKFVKFSGQLQAFDLPFLFDSIGDVHKLVDHPVADKMTDPLKSKGLRALGFWDNGMKVFSIKGPKPLMDVPDDFNGMKFRIQSSDVHSEMIKALGGTPQKLPFKEVYTALGQGVVDGQENAWSNVYSKKFHEVQDYITVSNHSYLGYLLVVSEQFWSNLPAEIRTELEKAVKEATMANRRFAAEADSGDRLKVEQAGFAKVVDMPVEKRKAWRQVTMSVEDKFRDEIGADLLKEIHQVLDN